MVEAKVQPQDIDQLQSRPERRAALLTPSTQRTTPELNGTLSRISADATQDQRTGRQLLHDPRRPPAEEIARLGDVKLVPGMPVEAFVQTGDRRAISYLVKPMKDQFARAFKER